MEMFDELKNIFNSPFITRKQIYELTGGILTERVLQDLDYKNKGISDRCRLVGRVVYPIESVIQWLKENTETIIK